MEGFDAFTIRQLLGPSAAPMDQLLAAGVASPRADQRSPNRLIGVPDHKLQGMEGGAEEMQRRAFFGTFGIPGVKPRAPVQNVNAAFIG